MKIFLLGTQKQSRNIKVHMWKELSIVGYRKKSSALDYIPIYTNCFFSMVIGDIIFHFRVSLFKYKNRQRKLLLQIARNCLSILYSVKFVCN